CSRHRFSPECGFVAFTAEFAKESQRSLCKPHGLPTFVFHCAPGIFSACYAVKVFVVVAAPALASSHSGLTASAVKVLALRAEPFRPDGKLQKLITLHAFNSGSADVGIGSDHS